MNKLVFLSISLLFLTGCRDQRREKQLQQREAALTRREQEVSQRETALALREQSLALKQAAPPQDTIPPAAPADTALLRSLPGTWATHMSCIETDCPGSAIGDSKNEQWEFAVEQNTVRATASFNNKVIRAYSGTLEGSELKMTARHIPNETLPDASFTVLLQGAGERRLEGRREISKPTPDNCRIVYALELTKEPAKATISIR
jgi:hypothetical protein